MANNDLQHVWRTQSSSDHSGFFVWDIMEVLGAPFKESYFIKCSDDSFIAIKCYHFFAKENADKFFNNDGDHWMTVERI